MDNSATARVKMCEKSYSGCFVTYLECLSVVMSRSALTLRTPSVSVTQMIVDFTLWRITVVQQCLIDFASIVLEENQTMTELLLLLLLHQQEKREEHDLICVFRESKRNCLQ